MFCSKCGKEIGEDSNFCYSCGSKLVEKKLQQDSPTSFVDIAKDQSPGASQEKIFNQENGEMGVPGHVPSFTSTLQPLKHRRRMIRKNHYGSTIGIVIGALALLRYCSKAGQGLPPDVSMFVLGSITLIGSLAYRSAKVRKLKEAKHPKLRLALEIIGMVAIIAFIFMQVNLSDKIQNEPVRYAIAPFWVIIAYLGISFYPDTTGNPER